MLTCQPFKDRRHHPNSEPPRLLRPGRSFAALRFVPRTCSPSSHQPPSPSLKALTNRLPQLMPDEIQYDASATPAQFTNNADIVIEQGTHVRVKIIGLRTEVGEMWAIGSINGDFLGYVLFTIVLISVHDPWFANNTGIVACRVKRLTTARPWQQPASAAAFLRFIHDYDIPPLHLRVDRSHHILCSSLFLSRRQRRFPGSVYHGFLSGAGGEVGSSHMRMKIILVSGLDQRFSFPISMFWRRVCIRIRFSSQGPLRDGYCRVG